MPVKKKIPIVSILWLKQKTGNCITGTTNDEVLTRGFKIRRAYIPKILLKNLIQTTICCFTHLTSAPAIRHNLSC